MTKSSNYKCFNKYSVLLALGLIMTTSNPSRLIHNFRDNDNDNAPTNQMHYKSLQNSFLFNYQTIIFRTNLKIQ